MIRSIFYVPNSTKHPRVLPFLLIKLHSFLPFVDEQEGFILLFLVNGIWLVFKSGWSDYNLIEFHFGVKKETGLGKNTIGRSQNRP